MTNRSRCHRTFWKMLPWGALLVQKVNSPGTPTRLAPVHIYIVKRTHVCLYDYVIFEYKWTLAFVCERRTQQRRFIMKFWRGGGQGGGGRMHKGSDSFPSLWWRRVIARNLLSLSRTSKIVVRSARWH
ncbi:hypothetical protein CDAR_485271 [Caerostris darwini]|uniref:Secreted protein n=1 Tax=Caerostris darwini TaxID=1538125 RepID=A0AAV4PDF7_9ARAC|nr:hypothetical protein CDAR_485271 [Caerostris darwini]